MSYIYPYHGIYHWPEIKQDVLSFKHKSISWKSTTYSYDLIQTTLAADTVLKMDSGTFNFSWYNKMAEKGWPSLFKGFRPEHCQKPISNS